MYLSAVSLFSAIPRVSWCHGQQVSPFQLAQRTANSSNLNPTQRDPNVHGVDNWQHFCVPLEDVGVEVFFTLSSQGSGDPQVCDKGEDK